MIDEQIEIKRGLSTISDSSQTKEQIDNLIAAARRFSFRPPSFMTNLLSTGGSAERTLPDGVIHRTQIDKKLTNTNNYMP